VAAGVGPWDALIREGQSKVSPAPPLTLGSDLSGVVESFGPDVTNFHVGDEVYGVTNPQFCGAHAEYALASSGMMAAKPRSLTHVEAASVPVIAVTAWQMLFEYAHVAEGQSVAILGAGGNVGAYAVQFAARGDLRVIAIAGSRDAEFVRSLGAETIIDYKTAHWENAIPSVDVLIDTVGGESAQRAFPKVKSGGTFVSVVSSGALPERSDVRSMFFYAQVTTARLRVITKLLDEGKIRPRVGSMLPLTEARAAHYMLGGAPHKLGKIVLEVGKETL
jgi:NADPH:quinone reductase-like Zn-dependent oxidoreductase